MMFTTSFVTAIFASVQLVMANPMPVEGSSDILAKRETSFGNPDLVTDQGNRFKVNYGSPNGHPNACPGHYICYIYRDGAAHDDVSLGNPDDFVDEGDRWRLNYGSTKGHPNACDGHYICYITK
ncbi:hypothetical protein HETIRDRAFT_418080 [Heterobasidion irregulare TC 32-1]|uniref:Uncharacterized protein n=1 Tax=Heterobasidion irregulare (strain TC 32-1) TaxID=747525 RepID=W4KAK8_HETIT|nr:uncharacterized protein HETIRDRAFT_418080 [Heterobasidion irregulare TC 32-1]ETW82121.1 hypothetical protein HETIRDRAFT_418080 [Heterobasidion irregulare TC 32-1]